jgi:hypothetical protein
MPGDAEGRLSGQQAASNANSNGPAKDLEAHSIQDRSPLRQALDTAIAEANGAKLSMKDLTVLAVQNDPFRIDTTAAHRDGAWLAMHVDRLVPAHKKIHLRGLHYVLVTDEPVKPNGDTYRNNATDWKWLQEKAADAARWLKYIPFDRIIDKRNDAPVVRVGQRSGQPWPWLSAKVDIDIPDAADIDPVVGLADFQAAQPYRIVMIGEKSSLDDALAPIASSYGADLYLPTGEMSDTLIYNIASVGAADGRPMVVLYFSDADPAGWQMPISVGQKLRAFKAGFFPELEFCEYRVGLTPDQVREYGLPSTPLKETELRANDWYTAFGLEQTEIDALATLRPDALRQLARDAIKPFYDTTLDRRVSAARWAWTDEAQAVINNGIDQEQLGNIRAELEAKLAELRNEIDSINNALRINISDFDLPPIPPVPEPEVSGSNGKPLLDSSWSFAAQCKALIDSKAYKIDGDT